MYEDKGYSTIIEEYMAKVIRMTFDHKGRIVIRIRNRMDVKIEKRVNTLNYFQIKFAKNHVYSYNYL